MKMKNNFHNTEMETRRTDADLERIAHAIYSGIATDAEKAFRRRACRTLCGIKGCTCGDDFGRRGPQGGK
jgi:hypothetical protein